MLAFPSSVVHLIARMFVSVLYWLVLFPAVAVIITPFIFLLAFRDKSPYFSAIQARYHACYVWWLDSFSALSVDWK